MAIGLGQMLIGGLIGSQMSGGGLLGMGKKPEDEMPQQTASNNTGNNFISGISNQMFKGMSREDVARLGIGFNSMTLEPNASLAASFQSTIDNETKKTNRNATVEALIKMGKPNLGSLVKSGAMDVNTAMTLAFKEGKGDVNGTQAWMETFRGKGTAEDDAQIDSYRALIASAEGDPVAIRKYVEMFSNDFNVGTKDLKDTVSAIQIQQEDGMVGGVEMKAGQKYTIVTDEFGTQTVKIIEGALGETEGMKYDRQLEQELNATDIKTGTKRADEAFLDASSAINSVQKYISVMRTLKNPDGTYNEDALTGWAFKYLPDFTDDQAFIGSVAKLMGIDVINMATFGALSEKEMQMAMATNLNTDLPPEELYGQIKLMVESRQKLAQGMMERARQYEAVGYSEKAFRALRVKENQGHLASRYLKMSKDVKSEIRATQYQAYTAKAQKSGVQPMEYEAWNSSPNTMTAYDAWSYVNFNDRAKFISQMPDMTGKKYLDIMGNTEFALDWWNTNVGGM